MEEINNYRSKLQQKLQAITIPDCTAHCMDYNCTDESHSSARDNVMLDILLAVVEVKLHICAIDWKCRRCEWHQESAPWMEPASGAVQTS